MHTHQCKHGQLFPTRLLILAPLAAMLVSKLLRLPDLPTASEPLHSAGRRAAACSGPCNHRTPPPPYTHARTYAPKLTHAPQTHAPKVPSATAPAARTPPTRSRGPCGLARSGQPRREAVSGARRRPLLLMRTLLLLLRLLLRHTPSPLPRQKETNLTRPPHQQHYHCHCHCHCQCHCHHHCLPPTTGPLPAGGAVRARSCLLSSPASARCALRDAVVDTGGQKNPP
jgi:hypothetical protein